LTGALRAVLTCREANHRQLGRDLGVTLQTAGRWLALPRRTLRWIEISPHALTTGSI